MGRFLQAGKGGPRRSSKHNKIYIATVRTTLYKKEEYPPAVLLQAPQELLPNSYTRWNYRPLGAHVSVKVRFGIFFNNLVRVLDFTNGGMFGSVLSAMFSEHSYRFND